jgi:hypothetical protein
MLPKCKVGNCSQCELENTNCVKVGKELFCLSCHRQNKANSQMEKLVNNNSKELEIWFEERHNEMKGTCKHCAGRTEKGKSSFKCSIAHILPKALFPSVKSHPLNWIELCFYGNSCHTNFDNYMIEIEELKCFQEVIEKFIQIFPNIEEKERRRIPEILLKYVK